MLKESFLHTMKFLRWYEVNLSELYFGFPLKYNQKCYISPDTKAIHLVYFDGDEWWHDIAYYDDGYNTQTISGFLESRIFNEAEGELDTKHGADIWFYLNDVLSGDGYSKETPPPVFNLEKAEHYFQLKPKNYSFKGEK